MTTPMGRPACRRVSSTHTARFCIQRDMAPESRVTGGDHAPDAALQGHWADARMFAALHRAADENRGSIPAVPSRRRLTDRKMGL